jgi:hypothetical protein
LRWFSVARQRVCFFFSTEAFEGDCGSVVGRASLGCEGLDFMLSGHINKIQWETWEWGGQSK